MRKKLQAARLRKIVNPVAMADMLRITVSHGPERMTVPELVATLTDDLIRKGVYCNQTIIDMRDALREQHRCIENLRRFAARAGNALIQEGVRTELAMAVLKCVDESK